MKTKMNFLANMKKQIMAIAIIAFSGATFAQVNNIPWYQSKDAASRGAWGADTRAEASTKWEYRDYMRATATAVFKSQIQGNKIKTGTLRDGLTNYFGKHKFGDDVRFLDQPIAGFCTGFLIAPDLLVTAGHCITDQERLLSTVWIFDYTSDVQFDLAGKYITVPESNQYQGIEILDRQLSENGEYDYAIIRLNRKVTGRKPYKFRTGGAVKFDQMIAMIGSPGGLPLKLADSAHVTNNETYATSFLTDLDAFHGNSGGPVFNMLGFIEGILVRGPGWDYHVDETTDEIKQDVFYDLYNLLGMQAKQGNGVHRITFTNDNLLAYGVYRNLEVAIENNDLAEFKEWTMYSWIWKKQFDGRDNLIAVAAKNYRADMLDVILSTEGIDINAKDKFNTPLLTILAQYNQGAAITKAKSAMGDALDLNVRDANGETALMVAAKNGNLDAVNALIAAGADLKATNYAGKTARSLAKSAKQKAIAKVLKKAEKAKK